MHSLHRRSLKEGLASKVEDNCFRSVSPVLTSWSTTKPLASVVLSIRVRRQFTLSKTAYLFYGFTACRSAWFANGVWLFYVRDFLSYTEIIVMECLAFAAGFLVEVPSGTLADLLGRKKIATVGCLLVALSNGIYLLGSTHAAFFYIASSLIAIGVSLQSGSVEALVYDYFLEAKRPDYFTTVIGRSKVARLLGLATAAMIGGFAWKIHKFLPWVLVSSSFLLGAHLVQKMPDIAGRNKAERASFLQQTRDGIAALTKKTFILFTIVYGVLRFSYVIWSWGFIRTLMGERFGYTDASFSFVLSFAFFVAAFFVYNLDKVQALLGDRSGFIWLLSCSAIAWFGAYLFSNSLLAGGFVFVIFTCSGMMAEAWVSVAINANVGSHVRATAVSAFSSLQQFFRFVVVVFLSILVYKNVEVSSTVTMFFLAMSLLLTAALAKYSMISRKNRTLNSSQL